MYLQKVSANGLSAHIISLRDRKNNGQYGRSSYIHLTLFAQKEKDCANSTAFMAPPVGIEPTTNP